MQVRLGDEVRWINIRGAAVDVVFVDNLKDRLSCQDGFIRGGMKGMFSENASNPSVTTIQPGGSASLCFVSPGKYTYNARMEAMVPGGEKTLIGSILVE